MDLLYTGLLWSRFHWLIYIPTLYGHDQKDKISDKSAPKEFTLLSPMSHRAPLEIRIGAQSLDQLLVHIDSSQLRWLGHLFWMPLQHFPRRCSRPFLPRYAWRKTRDRRDYFSPLAWKCLSFTLEELGKVCSHC